MQYLSPRQANIVVDTWVKLDGHFDGQAHWKMQCDNNDIQDMLAYLVFKTGKAVSVNSRIVGENKTPTLYANVYKRGCRTCHIEEVNTDCDKVWCPTTNTGTFVCMTDEGYVFITGNSPFTNITIDWSVPDDLKDQMPTRNGDHLFEDLIDDEELCQKAKERGCDNLTDMCYKDFVPEMHILQKAYYEVMSDGDTKGQPFTFPIPTVNVTEEFDWNSPNIGVLFENTAKRGSSYFQNFVGSQYKRDENGNLVPDEEAYKPSAVRSMCCRLQLDLRELQRRGNGLFGSAESTGSVGVVTINLARLGYLHKGDKRGLYKELDHLMDMAKSTLEKKRVVVNDLFERGLYPYTKRYLSAGFRNHFSTIGINGMNELIRNYTNDKHNIADEKGKAMALEIINHMREKLRKYQEDTGNLYNLEASPSEGACHRFAREDAKRYPDIIQAGYEGHNYYTNSSQLPSSYSDNLFTVLEHQNELQPLYTGGSVLHLYMGEAVSSADACKSLVQKVLKNYRVPYITVTPTFSVCEKHGYISGKHEYCPYCDMELIQEERAKMKDDLSK